MNSKTKQKKEVVAVIPARGGSKGIPRKNLIQVYGHPLIFWSIKSALDCHSIDRVIVSTDDDEIADIAKSSGAEVPFRRPSVISDDTSLDIEVFRHLIKWYRDEDRELPECFVHLRPTGPARCLNDIELAINLFIQNKSFDSLRSVCLAEQTPYKMWLIDDNRLLSVSKDPGIEEFHSQPRQKLPKAYWQNGYVDIVRPETIINLDSMVGDKCYGFVCSREVKDIDYLSDVPHIEEVLKRIESGDINSLLALEEETHSV